MTRDPTTPGLVVKRTVEANLPKLGAFCQGFEHVIGHNILRHDAILRSSVNDPSKLMDRALLWLHEQQVVTLGKGLESMDKVERLSADYFVLERDAFT